MRKILFIVIAFASSMVAAAQWMPNPATNNSIPTGSSALKTGLVSVPDGADGMFIAWIDARISSGQSIFVQRILANGTKAFTDEVEVTASGNIAGGSSVAKSNLFMIADGAGGVICVWQDARNTTTTPANSNTDVYGQRISSSGSVLWTAGGRRLTVADNSTSNKTSPVIELVNATEAILVFNDNRLGNSDLFAQKILVSDGSAQWGADINIHGNEANTQTNPVLLADGSGGVFVVWQDPRVATTNADIYGQRITNAGTLAWAASGVGICTAANQQLSPQIVSDGSGGFVTTWSDQRISAADANIFAQRVSSAGSVQWTANGVMITDATGNQTNPAIVRNGSNYVIAWGDNRVATNDRNLYAQSIDNTGSLLWTPASGVAIATPTGNQPSTAGTGMQLVDDAGGNTIIVWEDARAGSSAVDIYAQKVNATGAVQWATDGIVVSSAANSQLTPVAALSTSGSVIVAWRDGRTAANSEIYASRIESSGVLPLQSINLNAALKNGAVELKWNTVGEINAVNHFVEKSSNGINFSSIGSSKAKGFGNGSYNLSDEKVFKGTMYYRIRSVDINGAFSYSQIVQVHYNGTATPTLSFYPNPVKATAYLQLTGFEHGNAAVIVRDLTGKSLLNRSVNINADFQVVNLPLSSVAAGTYIVEIRTANGFVATKLLIKE